MALAWSGVEAAPEALVEEVYTPERKGALQPDLVAAARRRGRVAYEIHGVDELRAELDAGHPVVVLQNLGLAWLSRWHYAVVIGYETRARDFVLHSGTRRERRVGERTFANTWTRAGAWGLLVLPPDELAATADERRWVEAAVGLEEAGQMDAAAAAYTATLDEWPHSLSAGIGLANARYAQGKLEEAERALRRTLASHPESADTWNNLAQVLADSGRLEQARTAARKAVALGGAQADVYRRTLSEVESR